MAGINVEKATAAARQVFEAADVAIRDLAYLIERWDNMNHADRVNIGEIAPNFAETLIRMSDRHRREYEDSVESKEDFIESLESGRTKEWSE